MAGNDTATTYQDFLSPHEVESVVRLEDAYNLQAKKAAFEFAQADGMPPEELAAFMGRMTAKLDQMEWEQRCEVAAKLRELTEALGATATRSANTPLGLMVVEDLASAAVEDQTLGFGEPGPGADNLEDEAEAAAAIPDDATDESEPGAALDDDAEDVPAVGEDAENGGEPVDDTPNENNPEEDAEAAPANPLNQAQRRWLAEILEEDDIARIEALPIPQRLEFAAKLGDRYKKLSITRINVKGKRDRAEQLVAFMGGKNFKEIAEMDKNWTHAKVGVHLPQMARSIRDRRDQVGQDEIRSFIPKPKPIKKPSAGEGTINADKAAPELTKDQKKWLAKVYDGYDDLEPEIEELTVKERELLAELLGARLNAALVRQHGAARTHRRIEQMKLFITGATYDEIATQVRLPVAQVKKELHDTTIKLKNNISQEDLRAKLQKAKIKQEVANPDGSQ